MDGPLKQQKELMAIIARKENSDILYAECIVRRGPKILLVFNKFYWGNQKQREFAAYIVLAVHGDALN